MFHREFGAHDQYHLRLDTSCLGPPILQQTFKSEASTTFGSNKTDLLSPEPVVTEILARSDGSSERSTCVLLLHSGHC